MFWPTLAIPLGALLMGVYTATALVRDTYRLFTWSAEELRDEDERLAMEKYQIEQPSEETSSSQGS